MAIVRKKTEVHQSDSQERLTLRELVAELKRLGLYSVPVHLERIAEYLGLEVVRELMDQDISGYLEFKGGRWIVGLNALHHRNRQRFTLAHEIAHYILHRNERTSFVDQTFARRDGAGDLMESEADKFAAEFLMPEEEVREKISSGILGLNDLAAAFGVSQLALRYRLNNLGYRVT